MVDLSLCKLDCYWLFWLVFYLNLLEDKSVSSFGEDYFSLKPLIVIFSNFFSFYEELNLKGGYWLVAGCRECKPITASESCKEFILCLVVAKGIFLFFEEQKSWGSDPFLQASASLAKIFFHRQLESLRALCSDRGDLELCRDADPGESGQATGFQSSSEESNSVFFSFP